MKTDKSWITHYCRSQNGYEPKQKWEKWIVVFWATKLCLGCWIPVMLKIRESGGNQCTHFCHKYNVRYMQNTQSNSHSDPPRICESHRSQIAWWITFSEEKAVAAAFPPCSLIPRSPSLWTSNGVVNSRNSWNGLYLSAPPEVIHVVQRS